MKKKLKFKDKKWDIFNSLGKKKKFNSLGMKTNFLKFKNKKQTIGQF